MSLVHHVCKEATGLESLFLISKSNCAFANFKDDATCLSAQQKLHDSKFQSVRLVSRLRKSTVEGTAGVTAPTGPAAAVPDSAAGDGQSSHTQDTTPDRRKASPPMGHLVEVKGTVEGTPQKDRFFILKSLTVEDLELSVRTGIWATQSHNEDGLNSAFQVGVAMIVETASPCHPSSNKILSRLPIMYTWCFPRTNLENILVMPG
jgi:hypothetical protein